MRQAAVILRGLDADLSRTAAGAGLDAGRTSGNQPVALLQLASPWAVDTGTELWAQTFCFRFQQRSQAWGRLVGVELADIGVGRSLCVGVLALAAISGAVVFGVCRCIDHCRLLHSRVARGLVFVGSRGISGARSPSEMFRCRCLAGYQQPPPPCITPPWKRLSFTMWPGDSHASAWDCHIHCWDPVRHPYRLGRVYTPPPALLESFLQDSPLRHVMVVQASVEDGYSGLVATLSHCQRHHPDVVIRGTIALQGPWVEPDTATLDSLHKLGVRSIRIHGFHSSPGDECNTIYTLLQSLARSYAVRALGWTVSAQLPLRTWAALQERLLTDPALANLHLIADHNGCATPAGAGSANFASFLELLRAKRASVKVSALYRRSPGNTNAMQPIIEAFAHTAPGALLWGSDWPHCDSTAGGHELPPLRGPAEVAEELQLLQSWLTADQWRMMMEENPKAIFA